MAVFGDTLGPQLQDSRQVGGRSVAVPQAPGIPIHPVQEHAHGDWVPPPPSVGSHHVAVRHRQCKSFLRRVCNVRWDVGNLPCRISSKILLLCHGYKRLPLQLGDTPSNERHLKNRWTGRANKDSKETNLSNSDSWAGKVGAKARLQTGVYNTRVFSSSRWSVTVERLNAFQRSLSDPFRSLSARLHLGFQFVFTAKALKWQIDAGNNLRQNRHIISKQFLGHKRSSIPL